MLQQALGAKCQPAITSSKNNTENIISQNQQNPCEMLISWIDPINVTKHAYTTEHQNNRNVCPFERGLCVV